MAQTKQTISVRRRSVPLKQSKNEEPEVIPFSSSVVCCIMAIVSSALKLVSRLSEVRRSRAFFACSLLPFRTNHQGDSGAKATTMKRGRGQTDERSVMKDGE